jgi:hypothetical protein
LLSFLLGANAASAAGFDMFSTVGFSTGEKPQSKLWYHDGSYWGALQGPDGVALYEKVGTSWVRGPVLTSSGQADVVCNGSTLFVLVYGSTSRLFKFTYDAGTRTWILVAGFPVTVPNPSGSETMVLDQDSTGRLWTAVEGGGNINVYYSTSADHKTWSSSAIVLQTGVGTDDIATVTAFGGNKIGVFWSDQNRDHFGFRIHNDADAPTTWGSQETVFAGSGNADDHIHLTTDSSGRVYAVTKDDRDEFAVHRRATNGTWTTKTNIAGGSGTRPIIQVAEADSRVYVLYTRWGVSPERIEYRYADINTLTFGNETIFISSSGNMNNVTGMKQRLPAGSLIAAAENGNRCLYNSFGNPPAGDGGPTAPAAPNLTAANQAGAQVNLAWSSVSGVDGYNVYRRVDGGSAAKINAALVSGTSFSDLSLANGQLCYTVRAQRSGLESVDSNSMCVDNTPVVIPGAPQSLSAQLVTVSDVPSILSMLLDEGSGQQAGDVSGNNNHGQLGGGSGVDTTDPIWVAGHAGTALQFDGSNDYVVVADAASLDPAGSFTIEAWVRRNGTNSMGIVSKGVSGARTYRVRLESGVNLEFRWEIAGGSKREVIVANALTDTNWHHVACVYDQTAGQNRVYVDGVLRGSGSAAGVAATNSSNLLIGAYHSSSGTPGNYLNGALDAVRIAPSALYNANFTPAEPGLLPQEPLAAAGPADAINALQVQLTWQAPSGGGVAGYNIYRSVDGAAATKLNSALVTATSFTDTNPVTGELCYTVKAQNSQGQEGNASNSSCVSNGTPPPALPGVPGSFTATLQTSSTLLQWAAPSSGGPLVGYNVYRKVNGGALAKLNSSVIATLDFTDSNLVPGDLCYEVAAVNAAAQEGTHTGSQCVNYTAPPPPPPSKPLSLGVTQTTSPGGSATGAAAYPFDEGSGQVANDATGNGHTGQLGTLTVVDTSDPSWTTGQTGQGLLFDGTSDRVLVADAADLRFNASFTVEAWVRRDVAGVAHCILSKGDSQRRNFWIVLDTSNRIDFRWETSGGTNKGTTSASGTIADTNWHHVACVFDQTLGQNRIYKDGILVKSSSDTGTPITSTDPVYIGTRLSSGKTTDYFRGAIDLVRIAPGALYTANFTPPTSFGGGPPVTTMQLNWQAPLSGPPAGYNVYRQVNGGLFTKINATLVTTTSYNDVAPPAGAVCYQVTAVDAVPQEGPASDPACPSATKATAPAMVDQVSGPFLGASPNPFNPSTRIVYRLPSARRADLTLYDVRGRRIATLVSGEQAAGEHVVRWSGRSDDGAVVASGAYFLVLRAGDVQLREKLIVLK